MKDRRQRLDPARCKCDYLAPGSSLQPVRSFRSDSTEREETRRHQVLARRHLGRREHGGQDMKFRKATFLSLSHWPSLEFYLLPGVPRPKLANRTRLRACIRFGWGTVPFM